MFIRYALTLASAIVLLANSTFSQAQPGDARRESLVLEEVLVVATRREQSVQDVAVAVTALSDDIIREAQITSSEDLTDLVPSLNLQKGSNVRQSSFNIRGIGTQSFSSAVEPSVSTMLDGVVMGRSGQAFMQLLDIQRVEVLRGPQGTLFGKNATGGVVHIITQDPADEFEGEVMGAILNDDEYRGGITLSGPVTDSLGFRLTASGQNMDGYIKNYYDGKDYNGFDDWSVRGKLRWDASDTLDFKWASDYYERDCDCSVSPVRSLEPFGDQDFQDVLDAMAPSVPGEENDTVNIDRVPRSENSQWGHSLEVNWDIGGDYTLTSITALRGFEIEGLSDGDLDSRPIDVRGFAQGGKTEQDQFTQELRITSPADGRLSYVAGLFYFDQTVERSFSREFEIFGSSGLAEFEADTRNWAAFGEATWDINDTWRLIVGGRYTEDELDFVFSRSREGAIGIPAPVDPTPGDVDENDFSGKIALQWDFSLDGMAYLSFTEGYKGPAFDLTFGTNPVDLEPVDPETSESWELGMKTTLWDGRLMLNAALFHAEYEEFQSQAYFDPDGLPDCPDDQPGCDPDDDPGGFLLINAGEVSSEGLELDFMARMSENLRLSGGLALVDAKIDSFPGGVCSDGQKFRGEGSCGTPPGLQDLSGGDLPFSPDWKASLTAAYTWFGDDTFDVILKASVRAQDEVQYGLHQDKFTIGDSYTIFDASLTLDSLSESWEATAFVKNLADEFYPGSIFSMNSFFLTNGYLHRVSKTAQRTYGLEMRYRW